MYGVYLHIPWCKIHCPYCAFVVDTRRERPHRALVDGMLRAWERRRHAYPGPPETLYFGGGTPSLLPVDEVARLIAAIRPRGEVTLEVNPRSIDAAGLRALVDAGVTRVSLGVQSFVPHVARRLGRGHGVADNERLVALAGEAGFRSRSIDLMFGVPGQSVADWERELRYVERLQPDHVSLYGLTIEAETPFARAKVRPASDDEWREMYDLAVDGLGRAGLERYELSNFARPGHRSVHNEHYWRARSWCGIGPGAHGWRPDGVRTVDLADVDAWIAADDPIADAEVPARDALAFEIVWSTLRHVDGLDRRVLRAWTGLDVATDAPLESAGLVSIGQEFVRLTPAGFPVSDAVAARVADRLCSVSTALRPGHGGVR